MRIPDKLKWKATGTTLGAGGQGDVHEVIDKTEDTGKTYALKALRKDQPRKAYERFYREIEAVKALDHPNIIKIIDHSALGDDFHYYVMEKIDGARTLMKLIESTENPYQGNAAKSLALFIQIVGVVLACEGAGIVHRDLSPANVLVLPDESIKIIDFGLCQTEGDERLTLLDEGVGTVNYMPPECESGAAGQASSRSDIYSAGKILWTAITGLRAFARESLAFTSRSMNALFEDSPETWHLNLIFERTIRRRPEDRNPADYLLWFARQLLQVVASGRLPLEKLTKTCPACGVGDLESFPTSHMVFGNPNPQGIEAVQCNYCGYCFAINMEKINENLARRAKLE